MHLFHVREYDLILLLELIRERGIRTEGIFRFVHRPTTSKMRIIAHNQQILRIDKEDNRPITEETEKKIIQFTNQILREMDGVICSDYRKGVLTEKVIKNLMHRAQNVRKSVIVDPKSIDFSLYKGATVLEVEELKKLVSLAKSTGKTVVFANGCFDLIHGGHIEFLQKAKALGDILVIGLNSDQSVRAVKGDGRPIKTQKERASILSALRNIDYITIFDENTPERLISEIRPDSIVYSDCWRGYNVLDVSEFKHYRINHSKLFSNKRNHINGIENFWNQAKRHMRKFNGIPTQHFGLFLKECEWRFNNPNPKTQLKLLKQWVKQYMG